MPYTQDNRPMQVVTPLGKDALLLVGLTGTETISQLSSFQLDLLAENKTNVPFDQLLGKLICLEFPQPRRFINGIAIRASQGEQDETFTSYRLEIVPQFWVLTRKAQSRIFQHMTVPDILKKVLAGLDVSYSLQGTYHERDYCVQYRETDFNFASRLMEEEGIFYFFNDGEGSHKMVVADTAEIHPSLPAQSAVIYENVLGGTRKQDRIYDWSKVQELRSGKYLLWDHCFELPGKHLEADKTIEGSVEAGTVTHKLKVGGNEQFEIYDYPGEYAQRFDGITPSGGERAGDLSKITQDNARTVALRMQQEAFPSLRMQGASNCHHLVSGHKFTLERHFNADGPYLLTTVQHAATLDAYRSNQDNFTYDNHFTCTPIALAFRPQRGTPRPVVQGSQTAVVVGPAGEEIFTDKYGRVKVQFHWDREGRNDINSSCWLRVSTAWAGKKWGAIHIPRIGQEVIVDFLEGDPDQPIIIGSVYNADQMPPYTLPDEKTKSTMQSRSTKGGGAKNFNEIRIEDKKGSEQIFINAEKDMDHRVENDSREFIQKDRHLIVGGNQIELVKGDKHGHVKGKLVEKIEGDLSLKVIGKRQEKIGTVDTVEAGQEIHLKAGAKIIIEAGVQISLVGPGGFVDIGPAGVTIQGTMVKINSGGSAGSGTASSPEDPKDPDIADDGTKTGKLN